MTDIIPDNLKPYFDIEDDDDDTVYTVKDGYVFRYEGFDTHYLNLFSVDTDSVTLLSTGSDWCVPIDEGIAFLKNCKVYELKEMT